MSKRTVSAIAKALYWYYDWEPDAAYVAASYYVTGRAPTVEPAVAIAHMHRAQPFVVSKTEEGVIFKMYQKRKLGL